MAASHDRLTPKISREEMREQIPNSNLIIIEKSAHFAPMTRTPEVNKAIIDFLK
ncbi:MAG: alpha/beta hydrolase [Candidatus Lokiarchaeota archaeon]|nr:alpha/beta hydrolase [Candidatus Lokiarchaeota archaeon]